MILFLFWYHFVLLRSDTPFSKAKTHFCSCVRTHHDINTKFYYYTLYLRKFRCILIYPSFLSTIICLRLHISLSIHQITCKVEHYQNLIIQPRRQHCTMLPPPITQIYQQLKLELKLTFPSQYGSTNATFFCFMGHSNIFFLINP